MQVKEQLLASLAAEKKAHDEERLQSGEKLARLEEKLRAHPDVVFDVFWNHKWCTRYRSTC